MELYSDEYFMRKAMQEAWQAYEEGEVPVGALIVQEQRIIAKTYNLTERLIDVTAHAEMQAITSASSAIGGKYLRESTLYVTLEPCSMCAGALYWAQLGRLVFAASDEKRGYRAQGISLHPKTKVDTGLLAEESKALLQRFFKEKR